jgi:hypothetical protein
VKTIDPDLRCDLNLPAKQAPARGTDKKPAPQWLRGDPATWAPNTLDRPRLYAAVDDMAHQPGFTTLAQAVAREVLACLDDSPVAMRVVRDMPMYLLLVCCMRLHHGRDAANPRSGVTLANLREVYSRGGTRNYASDTHLRDMLAWARLRGLLRPAATAADARVRRLEPTELMVDMFRQWVNAFVRAGAVTLPPAATERGLPRADMVCEVLSYRMAAYGVDGFVANESFPLIQALMQRRHGYHVFLALLADVPAQAGEAGAVTLPLSLSTLAQRFQVARGTIRNTLSLAEESGLLTYDGARETVLLHPAFHALAHSWMALEITWMAGLCHAAIEQVTARPAG